MNTFRQAAGNECGRTAKRSLLIHLFEAVVKGYCDICGNFRFLRVTENGHVCENCFDCADCHSFKNLSKCCGCDRTVCDKCWREHNRNCI